MVPYNFFFFVALGDQGSERVNDPLKFTPHKMADRTQTGMSWPHIPWPLSMNRWTQGDINQSPFSQGPPPTIAFKERRSNGGFFSPQAPPAFLGRVHAVCLIHSWLFAMEYINKRGKPLRGILMPKWSDLSSEIIVWNCLCQLPSFCSVLQGPVCVGRKNSLQLNSCPRGTVLVTMWPAACLPVLLIQTEIWGGPLQPQYGTPRIICCSLFAGHTLCV